MQLYLSISCHLGSRVIRAFYHVALKSLFLFSDLVVIAAKSENKNGFSTSEKARISSLVNKFEQPLHKEIGILPLLTYQAAINSVWIIEAKEKITKNIYATVTIPSSYKQCLDYKSKRKNHKNIYAIVTLRTDKLTDRPRN